MVPESDNWRVKLESSGESTDQFERRKGDHIRLSLNRSTQATGQSGLERVILVHEALPEIDFSDVVLSTTSLRQKIKTPLLVSSMTAGHAGSLDLNSRLAEACETRGWRMGVGSQRRELGDPDAASEWKKIRKTARNVELFGNLGLSQLIVTKVAAVEKLVDDLQASGMIIHLNALQEAIQPEGTPQFKGGLKALKTLAKKLSVPVIVKETGCGFSRRTLEALKETGVAAVDVSGLGGTHWGRIEGFRNPERKAVAETFADWGVSTLDSVVSALKAKPKYEIWASGGVRTGLDAAKLLAMGSKIVGIAKPILEAALKSEAALDSQMEQIEQELKTALFCTGNRNVAELQNNTAKRQVWQWKNNQEK
jgi:isopentenyl-diphosphate Delta-isomerase